MTTWIKDANALGFTAASARDRKDLHAAKGIINSLIVSALLWAAILWGFGVI